MNANRPHSTTEPSLWRMAAWPPRARWAIAAFAFGYLCFALLAQLNLWHNVGEGTLPGPARVTARYYGVEGASRLARALDPNRPEDDPQHMYSYLGESDAERTQHHSVVTAWLEARAPRDGWEPVRRIFAHENRCAQCHVPDGGAGHLVFDRFENMTPVTSTERVPMSLSKLFITAHNHLFAFLVASLLLSLALCTCRLPGFMSAILIGGAFLGGLVDVGAWFLTRAYGEPWNLLVMAGGAAFGLCTSVMAALVLWHALFKRIEGE